MKTTFILWNRSLSLTRAERSLPFATSCHALMSQVNFKLKMNRYLIEDIDIR